MRDLYEGLLLRPLLTPPWTHLQGLKSEDKMKILSSADFQGHNTSHALAGRHASELTSRRVEKTDR